MVLSSYKLWFLSAPPPDPLKDPKAPAPAFGGALTAALDVMAFTHDLEVTNLQPNNTVKPNNLTQNNQIVTKNEPVPISTEISILPNIETDDPLRDLVILSNDCEPTKLNALATKAANIEAQAEPKPSTTIKSLAGIFAGTETFVRKVEETIKKKYVALEPSDSEGFGGKIFYF